MKSIIIKQLFVIVTNNYNWLSENNQKFTFQVHLRSEQTTLHLAHKSVTVGEEELNENLIENFVFRIVFGAGSI